MTAGFSPKRALQSAAVVASMVIGVAVASASGCAPFASENESCASSPCAAGLVCFEDICVRPSTPREPEPDCVEDEECALNGSADGRACVDGSCGFVDCTQDSNCGSRICDQGQCAETFPCSDDDDCREGFACQDSICRSPCDDDADCTAAFNVCNEGRCAQQCIGDITCFGDICVDGICEPAGCEVDEDCGPVEDNMACNNSRCEGFLPCVEDPDCFDADFLCNDIGRCEERALCRTDAECGLAALCRQDHCRPVTTCSSDAACESDEECVAGRCVSTLDCRADANCTAGEICEAGTCVLRPPETANDIFVATPHQTCGRGTACPVSLFIGETVVVRPLSVDTDGAPLSLRHDVVAVDGAVITIAEGEADEHIVTGVAAGTTVIDVRPDGETTPVISDLTVHVLPVSAVPARVLVVNGETGEAIEGATVASGSAIETTDATGVASFAVAPAPVGEAFVSAVATGFVGTVVIGLVPTGDLRMVLAPAPVPPADSAAGVRVKVVSSGDELGPIGIGLVLPAVPRAEDATVANMFGQSFNGSVEIPVLGAFPIPIPQTMSLEASIPVIGAQNVKDTSYVQLQGGPAAALALEGRFEQNSLFDFVLGADEVTIALNIAEVAESMDALLVPLGEARPIPLVEDGDLADGVADIDNDGDITERIPDWLTFDELEISPTRSPRERVGLRASQIPSLAGARALVVGGIVLPAIGFVPVGLAAPTIGADSGPGAQLRVVAPTGGLGRGARHVAMRAVFADANLASALYYRGAAFGPAIDLGAFLEPPEGTFFLEGVPAPGDRLVVLPQSLGATTFHASIVVGSQRWTAVVNAAPGGGRSFALPPPLLGAPATIGRVSSLRLPGAGNAEATNAPWRAGTGPFRDVEEFAGAVATSTIP